MPFVDECVLRVEGGRGGDGCVAFRREKYVPFGGPSGGDGGRGGDVILVAAPGLSTLYDLVHERLIRARPGAPGQGKDRAGRAGANREIRVPLGTIAHDVDRHLQLGELTGPGQRLTVATGGNGGRGNKHFATSTERAPRRAEEGAPGEQRTLRLELRLMADVGLVGLPNVGKSTLIRAVSRARPKVAAYPFTTLRPHLGVVTVGEQRYGLSQSFVLADLPGLIPGASQGAGVGARFLRHLDRARVLLHLVSYTDDPDRSPIMDYRAIRSELAKSKPELCDRPEVVALTKADLTEVREAYPSARAEFAEQGIDLWLVSSATHQNLEHLTRELCDKLG
jgi:GTP-binding protein